jgi:PKD repeat protein
MGIDTDGYSPTEYIYILVTNQTSGGSLAYNGVRPDNFGILSVTGVNASFAQVWVLNDQTYNYTWNTGAIAGGSVLPGSLYRFYVVNQSLDRTDAEASYGTYTRVEIAIEGPITPSLTATPPAGYAPLTVAFTDTSTGYPTSYLLDYGDGSPAYTTTWWSVNPVHTYALPGTYNVRLTATNSYGSQTVTYPISVVSRTNTGGGGHNTRSSPALLQQPQQPAPAPLPGPVGIATQSYVIGTDGVRFEKDPATGGAKLTIDYAVATAGGAVVLFSEKRVTVYHRHSPGVLLTFYSDHFTNENGTISGDVTRAEFLTDPVTGNMTYGHVDASVGAEMFALPQDARVNVTLRENVTEGLADTFRSLAERNNMAFTAAAFTYEVQRIEFATTGAANVTFSLPSSWVEQHGGTQDMKIFRVSDGNGTAETIRTTYTGTDPNGNMVFRGDSFNGTSIFGLVAAKASAIKQEEEPQATIVASSKPAIVTDIGMFSWLATVLLENPAILLLIIALVAGVVYFGWYRRHRLP